MDQKYKHLELFFDWVGDAGCFFPYKGEPTGELTLVDIETMKIALKYLYYDETSQTYGVEVDSSAVDDEFIYDGMGILPVGELGVYTYDSDLGDDNIPECNRHTTVEKFLEEYPNAVDLLN